jgi:OmpA-OmpF porin, OOP family
MKIINYILPLLISISFFSCVSFQFPTDSGRGSQQGGTTTKTQMDKGVVVNQISVIDKYTVIEMTFTNNIRTPDGQGGYKSVPIAIRTSAKLYALGGSRVFNFIKADNIVYDPKRMYVPYGQSARFTLYFERLDPGIEAFDLFECNDSDQETCWNFYDLRVINPAPTPPPVAKPTPVPVPATKPAPTIPTPEKKQPKQTTPLPEPKAPTTAPTIPAPTPAVPTGPLDVPLKGTVTDAKTKLPVSATINFQYSLTKQVIDSTQSFPSNGLYKLKIPGGYVYQIIASAKGYLVTQDVLDLSKNIRGQNETKNILMTPFAVGDKVTLKNIYFEMSKADLLSASFAELDKLVAMMTENPTMEIELEGHTDIIGDHDLNLQLSKDRVWNVRKYLVGKGINVDRIKAVGYGDTKPIITKGTDEQRKINRRVEFVVLKM